MTKLLQHISLKLGKYWPLLKRNRPNFFLALIGQIVGHAYLAISAIFGAHNVELWKWFDYQTGMYFFGAAHLIIGTCVIIGMYRFVEVLRAALLCSISIYLLSMGLFILGLIDSTLKYNKITIAAEGIGYGAVLAIISVVNYKESFICWRHKRDS